MATTKADVQAAGEKLRKTLAALGREWDLAPSPEIDEQREQARREFDRVQDAWSRGE